MIQINHHIIWSKQKTKKFDGLVKNMIMNKKVEVTASMED